MTARNEERELLSFFYFQVCWPRNGDGASRGFQPKLGKHGPQQMGMQFAQASALGWLRLPVAVCLVGSSLFHDSSSGQQFSDNICVLASERTGNGRC